MTNGNRIALVLGALVYSISSAALAQGAPEPIRLVKLRGPLYKITATAEYSVNLIASIGEDGLLLVDTGLPHSGDSLLEALKGLGAASPRMVITTHQHIDHAGNNARFGRGVTFVGHRKLRDRLQSGPLVVYEIPSHATPSIAFDDTLTVFFNGEEIQLFAAPGSHTDTDIGVFFTKSRVAYLGDLAYGMHLPSFDRMSGDILEYGNAVKSALAHLPDDALVISGHGTDCTVKEMWEYQRMLDATVQVVKAEHAKGKSEETMIRENALGPWSSYGGGESGYTIDNWITLLVRRLKTGKPTVSPPYEPLFAAYKAGGTEGLVRRYRELRAKDHERYLWEVRTLNYFGNFFRFAGKVDESIKLNVANTEEFPDLYASWYWLADIYRVAGQNDKARAAIDKGLQVSPANPDLLALMKQIEEPGKAPGT